MRKTLPLSFFVLGLILFTLEVLSQNLNYTGFAFDLKTNKPIYTEFHQEIEQAGKHVKTISDYKDLLGSLIATRVLDFPKSEERPEYRLDYRYIGYYEGADVTANKVRVYHNDLPENKLHEKTLIAPEPFVIDAGFNHFVKNNWNAVMAGKFVIFNYVAPARLDYYKFRIRKIKEIEFQGKKAVVLNFESDNFIIRLLIEPIVITYDIQTRRVLKYEGISNIFRKDAKRNYDVKVIYPIIGP